MVNGAPEGVRIVIGRAHSEWIPAFTNVNAFEQ